MNHSSTGRIRFFILLLPILLLNEVYATDFGWFEEFNIRAHADPDGFRAKIRARFKIGDAEIDVAFGNLKDPADLYMVYRLSEMSNKPIIYVIDHYKARKGKGWGALAKSLGIKPGSREFHALKTGDDLYKSKGSSKKSKKNGKGKSGKKNKNKKNKGKKM